MPMKGEGMQGAGMMMGNMNEMHKKQVGDEKWHGRDDERPGDHESDEMKGTKKSMGDMSGMTKQMSERMKKAG